MMNARPISEVFEYLHTYFRDLMDIHEDNKQLEKCFTTKYRRPFDENSIASYAFNLPSISFNPKNEVFKDIAEKYGWYVNTPIYMALMTLGAFIFYAPFCALRRHMDKKRLTARPA